MNHETLFEKFELFADAPNAVERMRELILHEAFAGKLLEKSKEWAVKNLKSLASKIGSGATPNGGRESYVDKGIPLIRSMNVHFSGFTDKGLVYLTDKQAAELANVTVQSQDVLLNITGASIGRCTTAPATMVGARVNQHVMIIRTMPELEPRFLSMFLASPAVQWMINDIEVGATRQALTKGMIERFEIPLPPLAEQKRIVAKVDELMALCDRLAAQQTEREQKHAALSRASLARFAESPTPTNLELLFHDAYTIDPADLRKSILTLAVQGKLVPQDPKDEPAEIAVARIKDQREHLIAAKYFRRSPLPGRLEEGHIDIPDSWAWTHLGNAMLNVTDGFHSTPKTVESGIRYVTAKHVKPGLIDFDACLYVSKEDFKEIASKTRPRKGDVLVVNIGAGCGLASLIEVDFEFAFKNVAILNRPDDVDPQFLFNFLMSKRDDIFKERTKGGAQPFLSLGLIREIPFPLPPLAEQRRIVAKVDQLMALVDQLETQLTTSRATAEKLLEAVVAELTMNSITQ